jgi:hypothetical protein
LRQHRRLDAPAVVADAQDERRAGVAQFDADPGAAAVVQRVAHRFMRTASKNFWTYFDI